MGNKIQITSVFKKKKKKRSRRERGKHSRAGMVEERKVSHLISIND